MNTFVLENIWCILIVPFWKKCGLVGDPVSNQERSLNGPASCNKRHPPLIHVKCQFYLLDYYHEPTTIFKKSLWALGYKNV
jgi:hypothetical protein